MRTAYLLTATLVVLAESATAQDSLGSRARRLEIPLRPLVEQPSHVARPDRAAPSERTGKATVHSRRRVLIAATAVGAIVGGLVGGTYAALEGSGGCKASDVGSCQPPPHLWVYPVGGAVIGGTLGFAIFRF